MKVISRLLDGVLTRLRPTAGPRGRLARHTNAPRVPFALLVTALIAGGMALLLLLNTASAANEVRRHDLAAGDASIAAQVQDLRNEVAANSAPANVAAAAAALGMVPAGNPAFLIVGADGSVRVMGSAGPASVARVDQPARHKKKKKKKVATGTATATTTKSTSAGAARPGRTTSSHTAAKPSPTPTPTPTLTLPGGNR